MKTDTELYSLNELAELTEQLGYWRFVRHSVGTLNEMFSMLWIFFPELKQLQKQLRKGFAIFAVPPAEHIAKKGWEDSRQFAAILDAQLQKLTNCNCLVSAVGIRSVTVHWCEDPKLRVTIGVNFQRPTQPYFFEAHFGPGAEERYVRVFPLIKTAVAEKLHHKLLLRIDSPHEIGKYQFKLLNLIANFDSRTDRAEVYGSQLDGFRMAALFLYGTTEIKNVRSRSRDFMLGDYSFYGEPHRYKAKCALPGKEFAKKVPGLVDALLWMPSFGAKLDCFNRKDPKLSVKQLYFGLAGMGTFGEGAISKRLDEIRLRRAA